MRHQRAGKKLGRDSAHRKALYANLAGALIEHGRIRTTITKAKAVRPIAEQMITLGRRGDLHARRQAVAFLRSKDVVHKLFAEVGPSFVDRPGGYTRITRIGPRQGDAAEMAYLELIEGPVVAKTRTRGGGRAATVAAPAPDAQEEPGEDIEEDDAEPSAEAELEAGSAEPEAVAEEPGAAPDGEPEASAAEAPASEGDAPPEPDAAG